MQVLTHLKEKLQFVQAENGEQRSKLKTVDANVAQVSECIFNRIVMIVYYFINKHRVFLAAAALMRTVARHF